MSWNVSITGKAKDVSAVINADVNLPASVKAIVTEVAAAHDETKDVPWPDGTVSGITFESTGHLGQLNGSGSWPHKTRVIGVRIAPSPNTEAGNPATVAPTKPATASSIVIIAALLLLLCFGTTACKTTTTNVVTQGANGPVTNAIATTTLLGVTITPSGVYNTLRGGTATGARIAIQSDTNSLAYLVALRLVIGDAIESTNYNPAALAAAVNALPISSIHNATAVEAIQGGFAAFEVLEPIIDAKVQSQNQFLKPALQGIFDGIGDALGITAPPLPVTGYEPRLGLSLDASCEYAKWQSRWLQDGRQVQAGEYTRLGMNHIIYAGRIWPSKQVTVSDWAYSEHSGELQEIKPVPNDITFVTASVQQLDCTVPWVMDSATLARYTHQ